MKVKALKITILLLTIIFICYSLYASNLTSQNYILINPKILVSSGKSNSSNYSISDVEIGNIFAGKAKSANYSFDIDTAVIKAPPIAPVLNPVTSPTNVPTQTLSGTKDTATSIYINGYQVVPLDNYTTWSYDVTLTEGNNDLFITSRNIYGLQSGSTYVNIVLDTIAPTGTIKINNDSSQYTNSTTVTLNLSAQDNSGGSGISQMQFSNDNITYSSPEAYATTKSWALALDDGLKTVYAKFKDEAGNWSQAYSDTIILDTAAPQINILSPLDNEVIRPE